jgi:chemotaxis receptor (MCP) glutamine deamidase CheD
MCFGKTVPAILAIGSRNALAIQKELDLAGVKCVAADVGGNLGRTFTFESGSGAVTVRTTLTTDRILCSLR